MGAGGDPGVGIGVANPTGWLRWVGFLPFSAGKNVANPTPGNIPTAGSRPSEAENPAGNGTRGIWGPGIWGGGCRRRSHPPRTPPSPSPSPVGVPELLTSPPHPLPVPSPFPCPARGQHSARGRLLGLVCTRRGRTRTVPRLRGRAACPAAGPPAASAAAAGPRLSRPAPSGSSPPPPRPSRCLPPGTRRPRRRCLRRKATGTRLGAAGFEPRAPAWLELRLRCSR